MSTCLVCSTEVLREMPMNDKDVLSRAASDLIQGMLLIDKDSFKNFKPPQRRGTCIVERCARTIEAACGGCRKSECQRCAVAAELRGAEDRINADRDAELAELGITGADREALIDEMVENLCTEHAAFGAVLAGQWYSRRSFLAATEAVDDAPHGP